MSIQGALVLAAGSSQRFGEDKRLHRLASGKPMLFATLDKYWASFTHVAVVLRRDDQALIQQLLSRYPRRTPLVITSPQAHLGMGHSLADGVRALAEWDALFIGLADMPWIKRSTLRALDRRMQRARRLGISRILQPSYQGQPGHPVGFSREFFGALIALQGDEGARAVVQAHQDRVRYVERDDPGILRDLDRAPV